MTSRANDSVAELRLGRDVVWRLRQPGPPVDRRRPPRIGSVASASRRFAAALSQPVRVRRSLRGPRAVVVAPIRSAALRPPRWWRPVAHLEVSAPRSWRTTPTEPPHRGLPRAVRRIPDESNHVPGGILASLVSTAAPVRRDAETVAAGPMTTSHDVARLTAGRARADARADTTRPQPRPARPRTPPTPPPKPPPKPLPKPQPKPQRPAAQERPEPPPKPPARSAPQPDPPRTEPAPAGPVAAASATAASPATRGATTPPSNAARTWAPARTSRLSERSAPRAESVQLAAHRDRRRPPGGAATMTMRLGGLAALTLVARRPELPRPVRSALRRPPGRPTARLDVHTASLRLPVLPSLSRIANADVTRSRPFRSLRAAMRTERTTRRSTWTPAAATGERHGAITLAAGRGIAALGPAAARPRSTVSPATPPEPAPAPAAATTPARARADARAARTRRPIELGTTRRLPAAVGAPAAVAVATSVGTAPTALAMITRHEPAPQRVEHVGRTRRELTLAAQRSRALAMTGLLATARQEQRPLVKERPVLASAFGPGVEARVSNVATTAATTVATPTARPASIDVASGNKPSRLEVALTRAATLAAKSKHSAGRSAAALRERARLARDSAADTARGLRRLVPAPPRVSISVSAPKAGHVHTAAPAAPASTRLVPGPDGGLRPSLIDSTAALFAAKFGSQHAAVSLPAAAEPAIPTVATGAHHMPSNVRSLRGERAGEDSSLLDDPRALQELTDEVVDRIEARVIDELERRGRRHNTGVF